MTLPVIFLMGPTASGKTATALALFASQPVEIVSVDSAQIYRGMNIGTAKPNPDILRRAPHHLLDILEPTETYSAGQFCTDAKRLIKEITARRKIPLLVGGTMLYFSALVKGLSALPGSNAHLRKILEERADKLGWANLHAELSRADPILAKRINVADTQRIQRALEVYYSTGVPMSQLQQQRGAALTERIIKVALIPSDRARLHEHIAQRFDVMLELGIIEEVEALRGKYALTANHPSMKSVGYRQVWQYLDGKLNRQALREKGIAATRQLAKRQLTWLRAMQAEEFDSLDPATAENVRHYLERELQHG